MIILRRGCGERMGFGHEGKRRRRGNKWMLVDKGIAAERRGTCYGIEKGKSFKTLS